MYVSNVCFLYVLPTSTQFWFAFKVFALFTPRNLSLSISDTCCSLTLLLPVGKDG